MFGLFGSQGDIYGDQAGLSGGYGGVGRGLGGMSNTLMMAGLGLMSSPRTNPYEGLMKGVVAGSALDEKSNEKNEHASAVYQALRASGVPHAQAILAAKSPAAAQILLDVRKQQISKDATNDAWKRAAPFLGLDEGGAPRVSPAAPQPPVPSLKGGGRRSETPAEFAPLFAEKEKEYNLPEGYLARTAGLESSFNPNAKNPNSSASGLFQFLKGTARQYGLADPFDPVASTDAAARLAAANAAGLKRALGRDPTAGELYLAHQQGLGGATKILSNPNASVASLVGGDAARLNAGGGKTAGQFAQQWLNKFGASPSRPQQVASADSSFVPQTEDEIAPVLAAPAEQPAASPQSSLDPETQKIKDQYDAQIKELLGTGQIRKAEQLEEMRDASMAQRMKSMPPQQVASADNAVPGASPALRPSYTGTPPGYDWRTATDPGPSAPPAQQQTANVPLPPERPPETYIPRAPLQPAASQPPIASIDPNSSNAGAIQFAASGMGRGGMPAAPQPSRMAAAPAAPVAAQPAGTQVAQAPAQTATDASPAAQAQVAVQQGQRIVESTPQKTPEQYPAGSSSQRVAAQDFYKRGVALGMIAATPNLPENVSKFFAEKSKWNMERAGKFIDPTDAEKIVDRLDLPAATKQQILLRTLPNQGLTEAEKNAAAIANPNTPPAQAEQLRDMVHTNNPPAMRLAQEEMRARGIAKGTDQWKTEYPKALDKYTKTSTNSVSVGGGSDEQVFTTLKESHKEAVSAGRGLASIQEARKAVQSGGIFGFGADKRLALQKLGALVGVEDSGKIANTESFFAAIAPVVGATLRQTSGTSQLSEGELKFANRAAAGDPTLDEKSILRVLDILEKINKGSLTEHQRKVDAVYPEAEDKKYVRERALFGVQVPSAAPAEPAASAPRGLPEGAKKAPDGNYYVPDPQRPGKYLKVIQ
jgi:hypothetical protein